MNNSLVSIIVVCYNSAKTVIETLESIKNQTYQNLELIISDDCSTDETVRICREWLVGNKERFFNVQLITSPVNTGVCANGNRGRFAAKGEWLKGIAGDDILMPNCIKDYMEYVFDHPDARFLTAYRRHYNKTFEESNVIEEDKGIGDNSVYQMTASEQIKYGVFRLLAQGSVMFYAKEVFDAVGGFNPKYPFEDYPFTIAAMEAGYKIHLVPKVTVGYRVHQSISHAEGRIFNYSNKKATRSFFEENCFKYYSPKQIKAQYMIWRLEDFLHKHGWDDGRFISFKTYSRAKNIILKIYS